MVARQFAGADRDLRRIRAGTTGQNRHPHIDNVSTRINRVVILFAAAESEHRQAAAEGILINVKRRAAAKNLVPLVHRDQVQSVSFVGLHFLSPASKYQCSAAIDTTWYNARCDGAELGTLTPLTVFLGLALQTSSIDAESLPQDADWKVTLREWLSTLNESDFVIKNAEFRFPNDYAKRDDERIYRDWIVLGHPGREPVTAGFRAAPDCLTLARIEGDAIRCFPEPAALAWWIGFDFPGNPFVGSKAGMRRALVIAVVDVLMLETSHDDPRNIKPDFMGANLGTWAYTFQICKRQLPPNAQNAYQDGMRHYLTLMERAAPRDGNSNMDMCEIVTLAELDHVFADDEKMHKRLVDLARRILFGHPSRGPATSDPRRGTFHPAGYIGEADGPETSYNGISLYHLAEAAMISRGDPDWDAFMPEVIRRMVRFKAYNTHPEPNGRWEGPSSWATRTNDPYVRDQRDRPWRPFAEAMLTDEALFRLRIDPRSETNQKTFGLASREEMLADIKKCIARFNRYPRRPEKWKADEAPVWQEGHWPADLPYTWDHYVDGSFKRFQKLALAKDEKLLPPFARSADFNLEFDEEFWMAKHGDWGFQVEAVPHMSRSYDKGGSGALAGGSLATFWTKQTGVVVLGRLPDKWNYVTWDKIDSWPTHHLWGRTAKGPAFSSARQWHPWVRFETDSDPPKVYVFGSLGPKQTVEQEDLLDPGHVFYRRQFTTRDNGLHVRSELLSRGEDEITELWETLPIFLNDSRQDTSSDTSIEFQIGNTWKPAGSELTTGVNAIRANRFDGAVVIEFDKPQRVALSEVITTRYQKKDRLRNVKVDLRTSQGKVQSMPKKAVVSYLMRANKASKKPSQ